MLARIIVFIFTIGLGFLPLQLQAQSVLDTVCAGAKGETYRVNETIGSTYTWNVQGGILVDGQGSSAITVNWGNDTGIFELTVQETNKRGCPGDIVRAFVWVHNGIEVSISGLSVVCKGQELTLTASGAKKYRWSTGKKGKSITLFPEKDTIVYVIGSSIKGRDTAYHAIKVISIPKPSATHFPKVPGPDELVNFIYTGSTAERVIWHSSDHHVVEGKVFSRKFDGLGNFSIDLITIDTNGCSDTAVHEVEVKADVHVYIPNAFTPNADQLNQNFGPVVSDVKEVNMRIVNRWGELVFSEKGPNVEWDGNYKGQFAQEGIYVYLIEVIGNDNRKYMYEGTVHLIR